VTGASGGIGLAIAMRLARAGAQLTLLDENERKLDTIDRESFGPHCRLLAVPCNLSDSQQIGAAVDTILKEWGGLDVLVNSAGIAFYGSTQAVDVIIYATGHNISFPFLDPHLMDPAGNSVRLYRRAVLPGHNSLFFVGLIQPWGAIMPLAEEQSKWVAELLDSACGLPPRAAMEREIDEHQRKMQRRYVESPRHTIQVDSFQYLDDIRKERNRARRFRTKKTPATTGRSTWQRCPEPT
jgi:hypothetical protein